MNNDNIFDVIIAGGSYAGLAAGMALGRSLRKVLIIDSGMPCNRQTPYSHNFLTQDGQPPHEIAAIAKQQVAQYNTVTFLNGLVTHGTKSGDGFEIAVVTGERFAARKLIFATGVKDLMPAIEGFAACWGISVLHCPYCHGYEARGETTGILANGDIGFEQAVHISNWTKDLTLYTNGPSALTTEQTAQLYKHSIRIVEKQVEKLEHTGGHIQRIVFVDGTKHALKAVYTRVDFVQRCPVPQQLGCTLTAEGFIQTDAMMATTVKGIFACGDNITRMRTVAGAVAAGTFTGVAVNRELILEDF
jgi:thioredoxin reductase